MDNSDDAERERIRLQSQLARPDSRYAKRPLLPGTIQIFLTHGRVARARKDGELYKVLVWMRGDKKHPEWNWHYGEAKTCSDAVRLAFGHSAITSADREVGFYLQMRLELDAEDLTGPRFHQRHE